ncbi:MAG: RNA-binding S4 domain-containing protein [Candidatus Mcinerneyibacterium aminivorans]|uniref:RNA-binding S4 domain-containing protein n=1 Tax=Candidatus Mcinerneyibacterium aminivorans TaxID=2703815 RepID=A0A5D0MJ70_9BACT|nr:MAG: RNA-binding S4 domain-containing protein [Candidatus Mcinerneyibacterium aminivorans]
MRIDKYLKISRISKRRTVAKKLCNNGNVFYGEEEEKTLKPAYDVEKGDVITIYMYTKRIVFRINKIPQNKNISKQQAKKLYTVLKEENIES